MALGCSCDLPPFKIDSSRAWDGVPSVVLNLAHLPRVSIQLFETAVSCFNTLLHEISLPIAATLPTSIMRPAISWTQNETAKMLAYLDIAVDANSVHEKRNQIAILRQIEKSMNYKRGPGQIQGRLQSLWRANGRKGYPRLCFEQGSEALQLRHSTLGKMVQKERDRLKRKGEVSSQYQCAQPPHAHSFNSLPDGLEVADSSGSVSLQPIYTAHR